MRSAAAILFLVLMAAAIASAPHALAGSAADPELSDPDGDQAIDRGAVPVLPGVNDDSFDDVDIQAVWITEGMPGIDSHPIEFHVHTGATFDADTTTTVGFTVARGPTSYASSTATAAGTAFTFTITGTTVGDGPAATAAIVGTDLVLSVDSLGVADGGDEIRDLKATTARTDGGNAPAPITTDDQSATDEASGARTYTMARPAIVAGVAVKVLSAAAVAGADGVYEVRFRLTNTGTDADKVALSYVVPTGVTSQATMEDLVAIPLGGGAAVERSNTFVIDDSVRGDVSVTVKATTERGAKAEAAAHLREALANPPPAPGEREVKPHDLDFLSPAAEGIGLDKALGSYAEFFLLALFVLVVVVGVFLLMTLGRGVPFPASEGSAPLPANVAAKAPEGRILWRKADGGSVELELVGPWKEGEGEDDSDDAPAPPVAAAAPPPRRLHDPADRAKLEALLAEGRKRSDRDWARMSPADPTKPVDFPSRRLPSEDADTPHSHLHRVLPGKPTPAHALEGAAAVKLDSVSHEPKHPRPGTAMKTTASLHNESSTDVLLRVVLSLDGHPKSEERVEMGPGQKKSVVLPWTASDGANRVSVQVFTQ